MLGVLLSAVASPGHARVRVVAEPSPGSPGSASRDGNAPRAQGAQGARGTQPQRQQNKQPVGVVLSHIDPKAAGPGSVITISGELVHQSRVSYGGVTVRLRASASLIANRGDLQTFASGSTAVPDPPTVVANSQLSPPTLAPGNRRPWTLKVSPKQLGLRNFGVYPITVDAVDAAGRLLGHQRSVLTYVPKEKARQPRPTQVAWVWPVIDRPHRAHDRTFLDEDLEADLTQNGRLAGLVAAARSTSTPITWAVDPSVLDDARAMAGGNGYALPAGKRKPKSVAAENWLRELKAASAGEDMLATPYADPDIVALVRAGMPKDVAFAVAKARETVQDKDLLSSRFLPGTVWPPGGYLDRETLEQLQAIGSREVLVSGGAAPPVPTLPVTPNATGTFSTAGGPVTALVADQVIGQVLSTATRRPGATVLAEQRFLAETAMISMELPRTSRTLVVVPPRRWNPDPELARALLADTASLPWIKPVPLRQVARGKPVRRTLVYPQSLRQKELGRRHLAKVRSLRSGIDRLVSTFDNPRDNPLERGIPRTESATLRGRASTAKRVREELGKALDNELDEVRVRATTVSLAGRSGPVPVTIVNDLPNQTVTVRLEVESLNTARLRVGEYTKTRKVGPQQKETIRVNMTAITNGVTPVTLRLTTPDGKKLGKDEYLQVRTSTFGKVALSITGSALGVLFLGVGVGVIRRSRRRDEAEEPL